MGGRGLAYRLTDQVRPTHYRLDLTLDPARSRVYRGTVEVRVALLKPQREIVLHAADLRIVRATVVGEAGEEPATVQARPNSETVCIRTRGSFRRGEHALRIVFRGRLRDDLRGLYQAQSDGMRYAFTQLQATDARRVFPCFDEPAFKATFELSVTTGATHAVVSNMPVVTEVRSGDRKTVQFAATPLLSTYLLALAVGPLEGSTVTRVGSTPVRVWHRPGQAGMTRFARATAKACLARLEQYFDLPYPYEKLDLVAVPDFEIGAMENAGAVFFRETLLLIDDRRTSLPERKRAAEVICHELAHMWFGNLVTMAWWDDLWLNEAFATWIAFAVVDAWRPEWQMWNDFGIGRNAALELDALSHTHAIYCEVNTPAEAAENFDLITYEKGAAVVRMLECYLGEETFRAGVRAYIREHSGGNTVAADFWRALGHAAGERGLAAMMRTWVVQEGHPVVRLEPTDGTAGPCLMATQERFRAAGPPGKSRAGRPLKSVDRGPVWRIPVVLKELPGTSARKARTTPHLLRRRSQSLPLKRTDAVHYANAEQAGCFRVKYDDATLVALSSRLDLLTVPERAGLVADTWALTHAGYGRTTSLVALLMAFAKEPHADVLSAVSHAFGRLTAAIRALDADTFADMTAQIRDVYSPELDKIGLKIKRSDTEATTLRRATLLELVGRVGDCGSTRSAARVLCDRYLERPTSVAPNLVGTVLSLAAMDGDGGLFEPIARVSLESPTPQGQRRARLALADFRQPAEAKRLHALCLTPHIPTQDVALVLARQLDNPAARDETWAFIRKRWPRLQRRLTPMLVTRLIGALSALEPRAMPEVSAFFRQHPVPTARRTLRQVRERGRLEQAFRRRLRRELSEL